VDFDAIPYIRITPGAQGILKSACHPECNPRKAASHRLLGGTLSEAGAAIGEVATRRIMNHLSAPLYPNSCGICLPPAIPGYDKEEP